MTGRWQRVGRWVGRVSEPKEFWQEWVDRREEDFGRWWDEWTEEDWQVWWWWKVAKVGRE